MKTKYILNADSFMAVCFFCEKLILSLDKAGFVNIIYMGDIISREILRRCVVLGLKS